MTEQIDRMAIASTLVHIHCGKLEAWSERKCGPHRRHNARTHAEAVADSVRDDVGGVR